MKAIWGRLFVFILAGVGITEEGGAAAFLDTALQAVVARETLQSGQKLSVLVQLKEVPLRSGGRDLSKSEFLKLKLRQAAILRRNLSRTAKVIWVSNSILLSLTPSEVLDLAKDTRVISLYLNASKKLLRRPRALQNRARNVFGNYTYGLKNLGIPAWHEDEKPVFGAGQKVGVIDSGADGAHRDLQNKIYAWKDFVGGQAFPYDDDGHGTHVAGTIAGGKVSGVQIGVAPRARLAVAKVLDKEGNGTAENILLAMQWMADPDGQPDTNDTPGVVNNSWGIEDYNATIPPDADPYCRAVDTWAQLGILAVAAAGNEGPKAGTVGIPARCPATLSVGAVDHRGEVADFSSRGPVRWKGLRLDKPEVYAPGVDVISARPGNAYEKESGTSMASPHVTGLAALHLEYRPGITRELLVQTLVQSEELGLLSRRRSGPRR
ncbi:MAG: S8 family serine peptidase [Bdellovibrionales bacterium]|nr:S8 family serine peptidase [Bdellovibrionales bacterium]